MTSSGNGLFLAVAAGSLVALQSRLNGELAVRMADGVAAALISFGVGLVALLAALAVSPGMRAGARAVPAAVRAGTLRPWHCLGGLCGAFAVVCQGLTVAIIGVAMFTVAISGGQLLASLLVDRLGIGPAGRTPITGTRVAGAGLAVAAVALTGADRLTGGFDALLPALLPVLAGLGIAWQQAVNGRVSAVGGAAAASLGNFVVGTAALAVAWLGLVAVRGWPRPLPPDPQLYLGGLIGVIYIATAALVVRRTGVLLLGLGTVAGQLFGALLLDMTVPAGTRVSWHTVAGCLLVLVAVAVATLGGVARPGRAGRMLPGRAGRMLPGRAGKPVGRRLRNR